MQYGFKLDPGEVITRVIHRHILDVLPTLLLALLLALGSTVLAYIMGRYPESTPFPPVLMTALISIMFVIAMIIFIVAIYVYSRNVLVFTNIHLVQVEQLALFQRRVSQLNFKRVEDVTGRKQGILQTLFNYGEFQVQSAGEQEKFIFKNAPDPEVLADDALQIHEACLRDAGESEPHV